MRNTRRLAMVLIFFGLMPWGMSAQSTAEKAKKEITLDVQSDRICFTSQSAYFDAPYTVQLGDTVKSIAAKFFNDPSYSEAIAGVNNILTDSSLTPGSYLVIPIKRFCMRFNAYHVDIQRRQVESFVATYGKNNKFTYDWAGTVELPGGTTTIEDLINKVYVPSRFVIRWMNDDKVGLAFSFVARSWLEAYGGELIIEQIRPIGNKLDITAAGSNGERFVRRQSREFLEEYEKLVKTNQVSEMREMVIREAPVVFETVNDLLRGALGLRLSGDESAAPKKFQMAQRMAQFFPPQLGQAGMQDLIRAYSGWSKLQVTERERALATLKSAHELVQKGQMDEAIRAVTDAREAFRHLRDSIGEYSTYVELIGIYKAAGDYEDMQTTVANARALSMSYGDITNAARLLGWNGCVFAARENYTAAMEVLEAALREQERIGLSDKEATVHVCLTTVYKMLGEYDNALQHNQRAFLIDQENHDWDATLVSESEILQQKADLYTFMHQYEKAVSVYDELIALARSEKQADVELNETYQKAIIYQLMGQHDEAIRLFSTVLKKGEEISQPAKGSPASWIAIRHKWRNEGMVLAHMGRSYYEKKDYNKALQQFHEGYSYYYDKKDNVGIIELQYWIGLSYIKLGFLDDAIRTLRADREFSRSIGIKEQDWELSYGIALAHLAAGRLNDSLQYFVEAEESIDRKFVTRSWYAEEGLRSAVEQKRAFYLQYAGLLLQLHKQYPERDYDRKLFTIAEHAKSIIFQESIAKASANSTLGQSLEFRQELANERMMMSQVSRLTSQAAEGFRSATPQGAIKGRSIEERLVQSEADLAREWRLLEQKYPRYADLVRPKALNVEDLQSVLKENETVLSYLVRDNDSIIFVISRNAFHAMSVDIKRQEIETLVEKFHVGIDRIMTPDGVATMSDDPADLGQFDPQVAYALYKALFYPVEAWIPKQSSRLFIAADDTLYTVPFEALIDEPVDMDRFHKIAEQGRSGELAFLSEYGALHYLIDNYVIGYIPAASVLRSLRLYRKPALQSDAEPLIAFADPVFDAATTTNEGNATGSDSHRRQVLDLNLSRLAGSEDEAKEISKLLGGHGKYIMLRENASEANVYRLPLNRARYLLFSTHGLLNGDDRNVITEPALVLSLVGNPPEYDGLLTVSEVFGLDLNAETVILSACKTYGRDATSGSGEGFADFARSFMYAGARSLLLSHWMVDADATQTLLVHTFSNKTGSLVSALWEAKRAMRKGFRPIGQTAALKISLSHPFFWAPFVYVGE